MKKWIGYGAVIFVVMMMGCMGENMLEEGMGYSSSEIYCYGNPDTSILCVPKTEVWDCVGMPNGEIKCAHSPDGQPGWTCSLEEGKAVCTKDSPGAFGGAGWTCETIEMQTTCTSVGKIGSGDSSGLLPPASGTWECEVVEEGIDCSSADADQNILNGGNTATSSGGSSDVLPTGTPPDQNSGGNTANKFPKAGEFRTQTPGGWGAPAHGNNPGTYRDAHFSQAFPNGLTIGCQGGKTAHFTSAKAIENFLPAGGTPSRLAQNYVDPMETSAGVFAGHLVAATLAATFDAHDPNFSSSGIALNGLVAASGMCKGWPVYQILQVANSVIGGCNTQVAPSAIKDCLAGINENFVDGTKANGYLRFP